MSLQYPDVLDCEWPHMTVINLELHFRCVSRRNKFLTEVTCVCMCLHLPVPCPYQLMFTMCLCVCMHMWVLVTLIIPLLNFFCLSSSMKASYVCVRVCVCDDRSVIVWMFERQTSFPPVYFSCWPVVSCLFLLAMWYLSLWKLTLFCPHHSSPSLYCYFFQFFHYDVVFLVLFEFVLWLSENSKLKAESRSK